MSADETDKYEALVQELGDTLKVVKSMTKSLRECRKSAEVTDRDKYQLRSATNAKLVKASKLSTEIRKLLEQQDDSGSNKKKRGSKPKRAKKGSKKKSKKTGSKKKSKKKGSKKKRES